MPDAHDVPVDQRSQRECRGHLNVLRGEQQPFPIVAIGNDPADQRQQQDGQLAKEGIEPQKERRRRAGDGQHQPVLRDLLHPRPDGRGERAEPQDAEVAVGERRQGTLQERRPKGSGRRDAGRLDLGGRRR